MATGANICAGGHPLPICLISFGGTGGVIPPGAQPLRGFEGILPLVTKFAEANASFFAREAGKERSGRGEAEYGGRGGRSRPTGRGAGEPKNS